MMDLEAQTLNMLSKAKVCGNLQKAQGVPIWGSKSQWFLLTFPTKLLSSNQTVFTYYYL